MFSRLFAFIPFLVALIFPCCGTAKTNGPDLYKAKNNIPPRMQWNHNSGYCGEVCFISMGLLYGQYISQYDARAIATKNAPQNKSQLLLGINDVYAASQMHLKAITWAADAETSTNDFLAWVKHNVLNGYPVAIGVFTNEYAFYGITDPKAGDPDYDHIVLVNGTGSNHDLTDNSYYGDDIINFSDNGLWGHGNQRRYQCRYYFDGIQKNRVQANAKGGPRYALLNNGKNYGITVIGVMDLYGDTVPVRVDTNVNFEKPEIAEGSNQRPESMPITLTVTVSNLQPNVDYILYRYNNMESVPISHFNAHAQNAFEKWQFQTNGDNFTLVQQINSDEMAIYRAVKTTAP